MVLETTRRKRGKQLLRLQHCKGAGLSQSCNVLFPAGSEQCKSLAESAESAFSKVLLRLLLTRVTEPRKYYYKRLEV